MRNEDTPAMPIENTSDYYPGFTKREAVMLEFAKELTNHYSRLAMADHCSFGRVHDEIMVEAANMTDAYFARLEKQT